VKKDEIARQYSKALFEIGKEKDILMKLYEEINELWRVINENDKLKEALLHQRVLVEEKKAVFKSVFSDKLSKQLFQFMMLLIEKRRIYFIENIINEFEKLVYKKENIMTAKVTTAVDMNPEMKENLQEKLEKYVGKKIEMHNKCDPEIIGGMIIKIGDYLIDGSIKSKLESLEEKIKKIPLHEIGV